MIMRRAGAAATALALAACLSGCAPTARPDASSVAAAPAADLTPLTRNEIREAQTLLARLGFGGSAPDGIVGPRSRAAATSFQLDIGAPPDGAFDRRLLAALRIVAEESGVATVPAPPPVAAPGS